MEAGLEPKDEMNYRQKIVLLIGGAGAVLMLLFLPVYQTGYGEFLDGPTFYLSVSRLSWAYFDTAIDIGRLILEFILVTVFTIVGYIIFRNGRPGSSRR